MRAPLRLAVDARVVTTDIRGVGRYERAVLRRLLEREDFDVTLLLSEAFPGLRRGALQRALGNNRFRLSNRVPRSAELSWFPANGAFFSSHVPVVATLHDAVPFRYPNPDERAREREQMPFLRNVRAARHFIGVSEFGKREICDVFAIAPERVTTIYHGIDDWFSPGHSGALPGGLVPGRYLLFVGDPAEPRKNFSLLHAAYRAAWPNGDGPVLALAGATAAPVDDAVATGRLGGDLGREGSGLLRDLYRAALAVVVPSYHETFGFPVLEAMACGTPVVASRASSLPEVGGDAALYAPPGDADAWSAALRTVSADTGLRAQLRERGLAQAKRFAWETSAQAHVDLFLATAARA